LEAIKKAVDDAAAVGGGLWLSYLFVLFYLAVAAGAVTHADLFFENPVKLPFLSTELRCSVLLLAPILFLIVPPIRSCTSSSVDKAKRFRRGCARRWGGADRGDPGQSAAAIAQQHFSSSFLLGPGSRGELRLNAAGRSLDAGVAPMILFAPAHQIQFCPSPGFIPGPIGDPPRSEALWVWRKIWPDARRWPRRDLPPNVLGALVPGRLFSWTATFPAVAG
jgi:hypothetical protein